MQREKKIKELQKYNYYGEKIKEFKYRSIELKCRALPTSPTVDGMPHGGGADKLRTVDEASDLDLLIQEYEYRRKCIFNAIMQLGAQNATYARILIEKYIEGKTCKDICRFHNISRAQAYLMLDEAIETIQIAY